MPLSQNLVTAECCSEAPCDGRVLFRSEGAAITSDRDRRAAPAGPHRGVGLLVSPRVVPPRPRQRRCASLRDGLRPALTRPGTPALGRRSHRQATRKEEPCSTSTSISAPRTGSPTGPTPTTATTTPVHRLPRYIGRDGAVDLDGRHARDHRVNQWDLDTSTGARSRLGRRSGPTTPSRSRPTATTAQTANPASSRAGRARRSVLPAPALCRPLPLRAWVALPAPGSRRHGPAHHHERPCCPPAPWTRWAVSRGRAAGRP
jgi:hypothetical protein